MSDDTESGGGTIRVAVISTDERLRKALGGILTAPECGATLGPEIGLPFTEVTEPWLEALREHDTDLIIVDLDHDPGIGIKFTEFLMESELTGSIVAAGSDPTPDLLLDAMRAGALEFLRKPVDREAVDATLERVRRRLGRKPRASESTPRARGRTLAVFGVKGGVGATTVSANLAIEIHRLTRGRTLLVDLDLDLGDASLLLGMEPRFGLGDLIENFHRVDSGLLASYIDRHESGIDLLAAPARPGGPVSLDPHRLRRVLGFLTEHYDHVVVDTPKGFAPPSLAVLEDAAEVYLVSTAELGSLRNLGRTLSLLGHTPGRGNGRVRVKSGRVRLVLNRFDPGQVIPVSEIEETVGIKVFRTLRNDYRVVAESATEGRPVSMAGSSAFGKDLRALTSDITGVHENHRSGRGPLRRFLGGLKDGLGMTPTRTREER